eukprot:TRINITY_DN39578_c3_g1_i1.p1 TRINITY_DN39578_c3_g1~~TRINITY_DN39578_c3_g1_i1.p1  ORF type:complete len:111 (+),score=2.75 TRINITY_DN39578_c3_g1_i1:24-356(+)
MCNDHQLCLGLQRDMNKKNRVTYRKPEAMSKGKNVSKSKSQEIHSVMMFECLAKPGKKECFHRIMVNGPYDTRILQNKPHIRNVTHPIPHFCVKYVSLMCLWALRYPCCV